MGDEKQKRIRDVRQETQDRRLETGAGDGGRRRERSRERRSGEVGGRREKAKKGGGRGAERGREKGGRERGEGEGKRGKENGGEKEEKEGEGYGGTLTLLDMFPPPTPFSPSFPFHFSFLPPLPSLVVLPTL